MLAFETEIDSIVKAIWSTLVELPIDSIGGHLQEDSTMTSIVHVDGAWNGAVLLQCSMTLAKMITASIFQGEDEPTADEVRDALGEVTNMVAGNFKALLPEFCSISLPTVAFGSDYDIAVVGSDLVARVPFACHDHALVVTVVQRSRNQGGVRQ